MNITNAVGNNCVSEILFHEKIKGMIRNNYLRVETKSPDFEFSSQSGKANVISSLITDSPVAVSFHVNTDHTHDIVLLNKILSASGIKHIAIIANGRFASELYNYSYIYKDDSFEIFNQFGLMNKQSNSEDFETKFDAVYLLNTDRSIVYSKVYFSNEPINYLSIIETYAAITQQK